MIVDDSFNYIHYHACDQIHDSLLKSLNVLASLIGT